MCMNRHISVGNDSESLCHHWHYTRLPDDTIIYHSIKIDPLSKMVDQHTNIDEDDPNYILLPGSCLPDYSRIMKLFGIKLAKFTKDDTFNKTMDF